VIDDQLPDAGSGAVLAEIAEAERTRWAGITGGAA
jgi:hypothetical protein